MLKIDPAEFDRFEKVYPGIERQIKYFEKMRLPKCPKCKSENTALVQAGIIGRTIHLAAATTKFHLTPNGGPGKYFCNDCGKFFDSQSEPMKEPQRYSHVVFGGMREGESWEDFKERMIQQCEKAGWFKKSSQPQDAGLQQRQQWGDSILSKAIHASQPPEEWKR